MTDEWLEREPQIPVPNHGHTYTMGVSVMVRTQDRRVSVRVPGQERVQCSHSGIEGCVGWKEWGVALSFREVSWEEIEELVHHDLQGRPFAAVEVPVLDLMVHDAEEDLREGESQGV